MLGGELAVDKSSLWLGSTCSEGDPFECTAVCVVWLMLACITTGLLSVVSINVAALLIADGVVSVSVGAKVCIPPRMLTSSTLRP